MKNLVLVLLALLAVPAFAVDPNVTIDVSGSTVTVGYTADAADLISGMGLVLTTDGTIGAVTDLQNGGDYEIHPSTIVIDSGTGTVTDYNTPVVEQTATSLTVEFGALYDRDVDTPPAATGDLFSVEITGGTTVTVESTHAGGIVTESLTAFEAISVSEDLAAPVACPFDVTDTATGYVPPSPLNPTGGFDIGLWQGPNGTVNLNDLNALVSLLQDEFNKNGDYEISPVPAEAQVCDVTDTATGYVPPSPLNPTGGFDMGLWQGPNGAINLNDLNALVSLLQDENNTNGDYEWTCP